MDNRWLEPTYVAEQMKKDILFACSNKHKPKHGDKRNRTVCLRELTLEEDGLLHCPVHGLEIAE